MKMFSSCCELRNNWIRLLLNDPGGWSGTRLQHTKWRILSAGKTVNAASTEHMTEHIIYVNVRSRIMTHNIISPHTSCSLFTFFSTDVSLFHMVIRYYCIFLCLPCRANYYRKLYSKYITTGHQFFCASEGWNTHSAGFPPFSVAPPHLWKPVPFLHSSSFFPVFLRSDVDVSCCSGDSDRKRGESFRAFNWFIYFAFLSVYQEFLFCHSFFSFN